LILRMGEGEEILFVIHTPLRNMVRECFHEIRNSFILISKVNSKTNTKKI
jgi:hypothetical protein